MTNKKILTFRRYYLDLILSKASFYGKVLDVGGKKINKRGRFRPPLASVDSWEYVNTDRETSPDYNCSADKISLPDLSIDMIISTELLEHVENPQKVIAEFRRILKTNGQLILTMPFLFPVHGDPEDYQRWTKTKLEIILKENNFIIEKIEPMGSIFAVFYDLLYVSLGSASKDRKALKIRILMKYILPILAHAFLRLDSLYIYKNQWITTGYFVLAKKHSK